MQSSFDQDKVMYHHRPPKSEYLYPSFVRLHWYLLGLLGKSVTCFLHQPVVKVEKQQQIALLQNQADCPIEVFALPPIINRGYWSRNKGSGIITLHL